MIKIENFDPVPRSAKEKIPTIDIVPENPYGKILAGLGNLQKEYEKSVRVRAQEYANDAVSAPDLDTDEELMEKAKNYADGKFADKIAKEEKSTADQLDSLDKKKRSLGETYSDEIRTLERSHANKERRALEALSKNGMTHSSTFDLRREEIAADRAYDIGRADAKYDKEIADLDERIESVRSAHKAALSGFEIDRALALEDKLQKLTEKRNKALASYEKTKDSALTKKQKEYIEELERENATYEAAFKDYTGDKKENYEERLRYAIDQTKRLSKSDREKFLTNNGDALRGYLGLYYNRFIQEFIGG